jgi:hypothetical protein
MLHQPIRLSLLYFSLVFGAGFLIGSIRVPFLQPVLGVRYAELLEMPIMVVVIWQAAQLTVSQLEGCNEKRAFMTPMLVGVFALAWLVVMELGASAILQGGWWSGFRVVFVQRDPVSGPVYALALLAYAIMPWYIWNGTERGDSRATGEIDIQDTAGEEEDDGNR